MCLNGVSGILKVIYLSAVKCACIAVKASDFLCVMFFPPVLMCLIPHFTQYCVRLPFCMLYDFHDFIMA